MRNFKIFQIISSFSKDELKDFENFIQSPYLTSSRDYTQILRVIYSYSNNWEKLQELSNEKFYYLIFPGKSYSNKTLRNRLTELNILAKKFIIQKMLEKDSIQSNLLFLKGLKERKLYSIFRNEFERINDTVDKDELKSYNGVEIKMLSAYAYMENQDFGHSFDSYKMSTDYMLTFFIENYFLAMIEYENEKQYGINTDKNIAFDLMNNLKLDNFIKTLEEKRDNNNYLIVFLYYYLYRSIHDVKDEAAYKKFSDIFFKNLDSLSYDKKNEFFGYMISRYFTITNSGKPEYLKEVFKLYNIKLKLGLHSELKEIRYPSTAYRDYVVVGLKLKKFKWVENFIKKYSDELPAVIRNDEMNMAYARLYLFKKEYDNALEFLKKLKSSNYIFLLDASRIKLRIFYEKSYFEVAFMELDRIKHYIKNNTKKIALSVRKYSKEYNDVYYQLLKMRLNPDKEGIDYLFNNIQKTATLVSKEWFIEKAKEMKFGTKS